jgi:hypothetical protein
MRARSSKPRDQSTATALPVQPGDVAPRNPRTRYLRPGDPDLNRHRSPPIPARIGAATAAVLGPELGELVYAVMEAIKRGSVQSQPGRLLLERMLPSSRPVQLDLPRIHSPADLIEAEDRIMDALNAGRISPTEMRTLQDGVWPAWRHHRVAVAALGRPR